MPLDDAAEGYRLFEAATELLRDLLDGWWRVENQEAQAAIDDLMEEHDLDAFIDGKKRPSHLDED